LLQVMRSNYPILPPFILKYKLETYKYLQACRMPVAILHGIDDGVISHVNSLKLKPLLKQGDTLISLEKQGHNGMSDHPRYKDVLQAVLARQLQQ
jgi:uncharacterized protein